uniref:Guanylate kinase-like domain-containing protein n=1 Tax=Macrostomum lignano TaxID=282301 RepID=A0A1I8I6T5_9PLAT
RQESARSLVGIFPSPDFQRRRQLMLSMAAANAAEATVDASSSSCCWRCQRCLPLKRFGIRAGRRRQDNRYAPADLSARSSGSSSTRKRHRVGSSRRQKRRHRRRFFEPQALLQPKPFRRRPLVLVGPPGVGRHELRVRLIESDPARFAPALLHTTRQRRQDETDGIDFEFTTRQEFQRRIREGGHFLETGQFNGDLYGISVANVISVVESGSVCVLTMQPAGLRAIRRHPARLMPYSVFVSPPPSLNGLRALRRKLSPSGAEVAPEDS